MANQPQYLTYQTLASLLSLKGVYTIAYAWLFGMSIWVTFFGGVIAFKALPRQQFGTLQHRVFPVYFVISIGLSSALLGIWTYSHPDVLQLALDPLAVDVFQAYTIASVLVFQGLNNFVVGPMTSKVMFQRHRLEKEEGKVYSDPAASPAMKALNKQFGSLHGLSSLANLLAVVALGFHGLWIGNAGLGVLM